MTDLLLLAGALLPSADQPLRAETALRISNGTIAEIGDPNDLRTVHPEAKVIDARELLLMPGLVNAHMHAYGVLAHGLSPSSPVPGFAEFLRDFWWPQVENRLDQPMILAALQLACAKMIRSGITSFCDVLEAPYAPPGILEAEGEVTKRAGLRAVLMTEASERVDPHRGMALLGENERFVQAHAHDDDLQGMLCLHTSFTCSHAFVEHARARMNDLECRLHLHLSESAYEPTACVAAFGLRPVPWYDRIGLWNDRVVASQVVSVTPPELDILAARGVQTVHMPLSNCEVGGGVSPVPDMIERGMRPALGTDGYINDMFEVMRGAFLIHKGVREDPAVMPARDVFRMATIWGAAAIGFEACGAIQPGAPADIIGVDQSFETPVTQDNVFDQVVLHRGPGNVAFSMVGGRLLMEHGKLLTIDETAALATARAQSTRLWRGTGR